MKRNHGKFLLLLLWGIVVLLHAEDFTYDIHLQKSDPYLKEPVLIVADINQTNPNVVLFFSFKIKKNNAYMVKQIDASHDDTMHHTALHYRYLLYPLRAGPLKVSFELVKRLTNEAKVTYAFSGDRDDFKKIEATDTHIAITPLALHVRDLPEGTQFVGDFTIKTDFPKQEVDAYEALPVRVTIEGSGYPPLRAHLLPKEIKVTHFDSKPIITQHIAGDTIHYKAVYDMTFSAKKSFTLPQIDLKAFNPRTQHPYILTIPEHHFRVRQVDAAALTDKTDTPPPLHIDWHWLTVLLGYLVTFASGFVTALLVRWKRHTIHQTQHPMLAKIDACRDKKALLQLLLAHEPARFKEVIASLEADLYGTSSHTLKQLKANAKEILQ